MAAETITVYIDVTQLKSQKNNHYSLYLAKKVNGQFTVIWQSKGAIGTVDSPSYEYQNVFDIAVPSYQVNYTLDPVTAGSVTFTASGIAQDINIGQTTVLDPLGLFSTPLNNGTAGEITITNQLAGNPHAILLDAAGKAIFVNTQSGMDLGAAYLTPIDTYQIWFDNLQATGTIIAQNVSNVATVTFDGGTTNKTISFRHDGTWQDGPLAQTIDLSAGMGFRAGVDPITVTVLATFKYALTVGAVTYLLSKFIDKFGAGLRPRRVLTGYGSLQLLAEFDGPNNAAILAAFGPDKFEAAVNSALLGAQADQKSELQGESWTVTEVTLGVSY